MTLLQSCFAIALIGLLQPVAIGAPTFWLNLGNGEAINFERVVRVQIRSTGGQTESLTVTLAHPPGVRVSSDASTIAKVRTALNKNASAWMRVNGSNETYPEAFLLDSLIAVRLICSGSTCTSANLEIAFDGPAGGTSVSSDVQKLMTLVSSEHWLLTDTRNGGKTYIPIKGILRATLSCSTATACTSATLDVGDSAVRYVSSSVGMAQIQTLLSTAP